MNIQPGTRLGRYEIRSLIGVGGMGQVYQAVDAALGREVAIKVLPPEVARASDRLKRFEVEAKAAGALNHPNILVIYDVGTHNDAPYVVSELLEGETLRERLKAATLPFRKSLDYAAQVARGLSAAHAKGIVHRDIKPENLFITKDGHVKILDFGIAKLTNPLGEFGSEPESETMRLDTHPGVVLGTAGYMAPEQVRGEVADHRADIFSFGAVFYEMLSGKRAFQRESQIETMSAILRDEPAELSETNRSIAPVFERIVRHCLEKRPEDRFQSTRDLVFDLETVSTAGFSETSTLGLQAPEIIRRRQAMRIPWRALAIFAILVALAGAFFLGRGSGPAKMPSYHQLTFRRGTVWSARFSSDTHLVVYSAAWGENRLDLYSTQPESTESRSLELKDADLLGVSSSGEMAVLINRKYIGHFISQGTLARIPLGGGAPREVLDNVQQADWSPDGQNLAIVRYVGGRNRLEYPIGKTIYETDGYVSYPRVSPQGDKIAFLDHPGQWDNRGWVAVVDLAGNMKKLSGEWSDEEGLAWSPDGKEIWFSASKAGEVAALYAVTPAGRERVVARVPTNLMLHDIARDGTVLVSAYKYSTPIVGLPPGESAERDLSWLDGISVYDLSPDGNEFVFQYYGQSSGTNYTSYLRKTDGSPAKRLGDGAAIALSPDGKWVVAVINVPRQMVLLPTGAGETRRLERNGIEFNGDDNWFPDGKRVVFTGRATGRPARTYAQNIDGGAPVPVTPEGITGTLVSPDGKLLLANDANGKRLVFPLENGAPQEIRGLKDDDQILRWADDGRSIYVYTGSQMPVKIYRLNYSTGKRDFLRDITPSDPAGIRSPPRVFITPDGKSYVYQFQRYLSELYLIDGLAQR
jgi:serine/threonine protein kinase/Tol biopolymer transport system component